MCASSLLSLSGWLTDRYTLGVSRLPLSIQLVDTGYFEARGLAPPASSTGV